MLEIGQDAGEHSHSPPHVHRSGTQHRFTAGRSLRSQVRGWRASELHVPSHVPVLSSSGTRGRLESDKWVAYQADRATMPDTSPVTELGFPPPEGTGSRMLLVGPF